MTRIQINKLRAMRQVLNWLNADDKDKPQRKLEYDQANCKIDGREG